MLVVETSTGGTKNSDFSVRMPSGGNGQCFFEICIVLVWRVDDIGAGCQQVCTFIRAEGIKVTGYKCRDDFVAEKVACPAIDTVGDVGIEDCFKEKVFGAAGQLAVRCHHNPFDIHAHTIQVYPDGASLADFGRRLAGITELLSPGTRRCFITFIMSVNAFRKAFFHPQTVT